MPGRMRDPGPSVTALAARASRRGEAGRRDGPVGADESWTVATLRARAAEQGIKGRSRMRKRELIEALRNF